MATATNPPPAPLPGMESKRLDWQRKVNDPLERLRGYIRLYVSAEGAAVLVLYLSLWFWIGMVLDYGFFKAFTVDWVQVLPWGLRAGVLTILVAGLVALLVVKVTLRLVREFRDGALALVLERRFPKLLGDRLITAIELGDPRLAQKYGYSQAMIDQTVREASERVDQVPVKEAFNWRRLGVYLVMVLVLTFGMLILTGIGYAALAKNPGDFVTDFRTVSGIWFERNILLENTIWPRSTYLELVGFPDSGELRVGRNVAAAPIRVRALKWVVADRTAPEGWRSMLWSEVPKDILGVSPPQLPREWFKSDPDLTVDQVDLVVEREDFRQKVDPILLKNLRDVFERLDERTAQASMARKMRKLEVPEQVMVYYKGDTVRSEMTLKQESNNEFSGLFTDLKETVQFQACAADYCTRARTITVVPPPALSKLLRQESQPAYLYHRTAVGEKPEFLKGKKQELPEESVYLGGETSRIDVPAGTDIRLVGKADKDLEKDKVFIQPRGMAEFQKTMPKELRDMDPVDAWMKAKNVAPVQLSDDKRTFETNFTNVTSRIDFDFVFTDTDGVMGRRHVTIQPAEDVSPEVEVLVEVIRKTNQGYMITPSAMVPFAGRIRDDHGIDKLQYHYAYSGLEAGNITRTRAGLAMMLFHLSPDSTGGSPLLAASYAGLVSKIVEPSASQEEKTGAVSLPTFAAEIAKRTRGDVGKDELLKRLKGNPPRNLPLIKTHQLNPDDEYFDVQKHLPEFKVTGAGSQPRYRLKLWVTATDTNVETGPRASESKERFSFIVVSDTELMAEIAKEEESLHIKMDQAFAKVKDAKNRLDQIEKVLKAPDFKKDDFTSQGVKSLEIAETVNGTSVVAREVFTDYTRILKEMKTNRIQKEMVNKVDKIVKLCDGALNLEYPRAEEAQRELQRALDKAEKDPEAAKAVPGLVKVSQDRMNELIAKLDEIIEAMGDITKINDVIVMLQKIEEEQRGNVEILKYLEKKLRDLIFGD
ncbi:MAG: hypothetical protein K2R98_08145 [Gemmataceae bacterium]|nr:hypothetical protein [Gemmataceae bacterium]